MKWYSNIIIAFLVITNTLSICVYVSLYKKFSKLKHNTNPAYIASPVTTIPSNSLNQESVNIARTPEEIVELTFMDDKTVQDLYQMLKDTIEIFETVGIKYSTDGGTMMGMVRNKGLIPWDDDIDLLMFHHDEPKLRRLKPIFEKLGYNLIFDYSVYRVSKIGNPTANGIRFTYPVLEISLVYRNQNSKRIEYTNWMMLDTFPKEWFPEDKFFPLKRYKFGLLDRVIFMQQDFAALGIDLKIKHTQD